MGRGRPHPSLTWPFAITAAVAQAQLSGFSPLPVLCGLHGGVVAAAALQTLAGLPTGAPTLTSAVLTAAAVTAESDVAAAAAIVLVAAAGTVPAAWQTPRK